MAAVRADEGRARQVPTEKSSVAHLEFPVAFSLMHYALEADDSLSCLTSPVSFHMYNLQLLGIAAPGLLPSWLGFCSIASIDLKRNHVTL